MQVFLSYFSCNPKRTYVFWQTLSNAFRNVGHGERKKSNYLYFILKNLFHGDYDINDVFNPLSLNDHLSCERDLRSSKPVLWSGGRGHMNSDRCLSKTLSLCGYQYSLRGGASAILL